MWPRTDLAELLGIEHPIVQAPMAGSTTPALAAATAREGDGRLIAPMAGRIVSVGAQPGETVVKGQILVILEAMKMEHEIKAPADGVVAEIGVTEGDQVKPRQMLAVVAAESEAAE